MLNLVSDILVLINSLLVLLATILAIIVAKKAKNPGGKS